MVERRRLVATLLLAAVVFACGGARAQGDAEHTLDAIFHLFDENGDGYVTTAEANHFIMKTFKEMDRKGSGKITMADFRNFSFGLADVAAAEGKSDAYEKAKDAIFKRWDRDGKGALTLVQYRGGVLADAQAARRDGKPEKDGRFDLETFKRAPFVKQLMESLR